MNSFSNTMNPKMKKGTVTQPGNTSKYKLEILPHAFKVNIWKTETAEVHDESNANSPLP